MDIQTSFFSLHTLHNLRINCFFKRFAAIQGGLDCPVNASTQSGMTSSLRTNYHCLFATNANKLRLNPNENNNNGKSNNNDDLCPFLQEPAGPGHFLKVGPMWVVHQQCRTTQHATQLLFYFFFFKKCILFNFGSSLQCSFPCWF